MGSKENKYKLNKIEGKFLKEEKCAGKYRISKEELEKIIMNMNDWDVVVSDSQKQVISVSAAGKVLMDNNVRMIFFQRPHNISEKEEGYRKSFVASGISAKMCE